MSDEFEEADFEEEDFQEAPEVNSMTRYEEIVFCPVCDVYMPYKVDGAIVRRRCPSCGKEFEGGHEVVPGSTRPGTRAPAAKSAPKAKTAAASATGAASAGSAASEERSTCAALTKAGSPCSNPPRSGSKYCASHKGYRPGRK